MKTLQKIATLTLAMTAATVTPQTSTWAANPPAAPQREGETLAAQVSVTRDLLAQVLARLQQDTQDRVDGLSHADFLAKSKEFNERMARAMEQFETQMTEGPLKKAGVWVDRMRAIQRSKAYTEDQKVMLIGDQFSQAQQLFTSLSGDYQNLLRQLYLVGLPNYHLEYQGVEFDRESRSDIVNSIFHLSLNFFPGSTKDLLLKYRLVFQDPALGTPTSIDIKVSYRALYQFRDGNNDWFADSYGRDDSERALWAILFGDTSGWGPSYFDNDARGTERANKIGEALAIYGNLHQSQLSEVSKRTFDHVLRLGCYSSSCLPLYSSQLTSFVSLVKSTLDKDINFPIDDKRTLTLSALKLRTKSVLPFLSVERTFESGLPFELTDDEYRVAADNQIGNFLVNKDLDFEKGCPIDLSRLGGMVCHSTSGCLNESERSLLSAKIDRADLRRGEKEKRQACLAKLVTPAK